jgi:spore germination protein (amino acid permease)
MNKAPTITRLQFIFMLSGIQISVAVLSLPRKLAESAGTDGLLALPLGYILSVLASCIIVAVMRHSKEATLFAAISSMGGKWAGKTFAGIMALYFLMLMYDGIVRAILIMKTWLLPSTSSFVIMLLLLVPAYKVASGGIRLVGRYAELVFYMSCWLPFVYLFTLKYSHWLNLLPFFKTGFIPVLGAVKNTIYPSLGMVAVFILYPSLIKKETAYANVLLSNGITFSVYIFLTIICFVYYSPHGIQVFNDPVISILKTIEFRSIERIEIPFISFYLFLFSLVWIPCMYFVSVCICEIAGTADIKVPLRVLVISLAIGTYFFLPTFNQSNALQGWLVRCSIVIEYALPFILLCCLLLYNKRRRGLNL